MGADLKLFPVKFEQSMQGFVTRLLKIYIYFVGKVFDCKVSGTKEPVQGCIYFLGPKAYGRIFFRIKKIFAH